VKGAESRGTYLLAVLECPTMFVVVALIYIHKYAVEFILWNLEHDPLLDVAYRRLAGGIDGA